MPDAVVLLPPSEGKARGGRRRGRTRAPRSFPTLGGARGEVARALVAAMDDPTAARRLLGVKGEALETAMAANRSLEVAPVLPAIERYTGVLFDNLGAATLPADALGRLEEQVIIVSGLWGLVRPTDPIPDYKLKIDAALPPLGRLARWWRPTLTPVLDRATRGALVWDLLPKAHAAVWADPDHAPALRVTVSFEAEQRKGGEVVRTGVTHWSKALKGALARHLLLHPAVAATRADAQAVLGTFRHDQGYRLDELEGEGSALHARFLAPAT